MPRSGYAYAVIGGPDLTQLYAAIKNPSLSIAFKMMLGFLHADEANKAGKEDNVASLWFEPLLDRYVSFMATVNDVSLDEANGDGVVLALCVTEMIDYSQRLTQLTPLRPEDFVKKDARLQLSYNVKDCVGGFAFGSCPCLINAGCELLRINEDCDDSLSPYDTPSQQPCQIIDLNPYLRLPQLRSNSVFASPDSPCKIIDFNAATAKFAGRTPTPFRFSKPKPFRYLVTYLSNSKIDQHPSPLLALLIQ